MNTGKEHTNKRKSESGDHVIDDTGQNVQRWAAEQRIKPI